MLRLEINREAYVVYLESNSKWDRELLYFYLSNRHAYTSGCICLSLVLPLVYNQSFNYKHSQTV